MDPLNDDEIRALIAHHEIQRDKHRKLMEEAERQLMRWESHLIDLNDRTDGRIDDDELQAKHESLQHAHDFMSAAGLNDIPEKRQAAARVIRAAIAFRNQWPQVNYDTSSSELVNAVNAYENVKSWPTTNA